MKPVQIDSTRLIYRGSESRSGGLDFFLFILYILAVSYTSMHHAPWRDETVTWVISRWMGWHKFLRHFGNCGHPPLWYLVQLPFARLGLPFETLACINLIFSICVAWLLLFKSPFSLLVRIGVTFSAFIFFQYAVVVRGYMMMALLFFLYATFYATRLSRPWRSGLLLALLFNTESFAIVPTGVLFYFFLRDSFRRFTDLKEQKWGPWVFAAVGALISVLALWPTGESATPSAFYFGNNFLNFPIALNLGLFPREPITRALAQATQHWTLLGAVFLVLLAQWLRLNRWRIFLVLSMGWLGIIFTFFYRGYFWHFYLIPFFCIFTLWMDSQESDQRQKNRRNQIQGYALAALLYLSLSLSMVIAFKNHILEMQSPYSGGKDMAQFIQKNEYEHSLIASFCCDSSTVLSAYLPNLRFWHVPMDRMQPYMIWDRVQGNCYRERNKVRLESLIKGGEFDNQLILTTAPQQIYHAGWKLELLHFSPGRAESYFLYQLKIRPQRWE